MDNRCCASIWGNWNTHQCSKKGKIEIGGKWYCGIHNPEYIKKKEEKRRAKYEKQSVIDNARWDRRKLEENYLMRSWIRFYAISTT